jgi:hypothetical protein
MSSIVLPGKLSNQDYVSAFWKYNDSGVEVKIEGGNTFHSTFPFQAGFSAQFDKASVFYTSLKPETISVSTDTEITSIPAGDSNDGFSNEIEYFTDCMESMVSPVECLPESALLSVQICYDHLKTTEI